MKKDSSKNKPPKGKSARDYIITPPPPPVATRRVIQREMTRTVTINKFGQEEDSGDIVLSVHEFITIPAEIELELSRTLNMGNFESAKIAARIKKPVYKEQIDTPEKVRTEFVELATLIIKEVLLPNIHEIQEYAWEAKHGNMADSDDDFGSL